MKIIILVILLVSIGGFFYYLLRPSPHQPVPAGAACLDTGSGDGELLPALLQPEVVYGLGLTYAQHIKETSWNFNPNIDPPVFRKKLHSLKQYPAVDSVKYPTYKDLMASADTTEPGLSALLAEKYDEFPALMDYEVELALVLLEDISSELLDDPDYAPKLGYFIGNDISSRSMVILGQGQENDHEYYGASKSFSGFNPVGEKMWVPNNSLPNSTLCVTLTTKVNGVIRQNQSTSDQIFTPKEMLQFVVRAFPEDGLKRGNIIMTGTPAGVIWKVSPWMPRLTELLGMDRFTKLSFIFDKAEESTWLSIGDELVLSGGILGEVRTTVIE